MSIPRDLWRIGGLFSMLLALEENSFENSLDSMFAVGCWLRGLSPEGVLVRLAHRIFLCLVLNYIFAWLTLRQGSIIPAAIVHTVWNIWAAVLNHLDDRWEVEFRFVLAAVIAYVLFRFWPISVEREAESATTDTTPEAAV